jgi:hypothetical protein
MFNAGTLKMQYSAQMRRQEIDQTEKEGIVREISPLSTELIDLM